MSKGPVLFDLDEDAPQVDPSLAPPPPDVAPVTRGAAMQQAAVLLARRPSVLGRWFWSLLLSILGLAISISAWNWAAGLLAATPVLGLVVTLLLLLFCCTLAAIAIREAIAFSRLRRIDETQRAAVRALADDDLQEARGVIAGLRKLYAKRPDAAWGLQSLTDHESDILDAGGLLGLAETDLLTPLDNAARREVEAAARQVATVTAVVPLALADVFAALTSNLRMIRRIAEIYGGRSGTLGSWRLTRSVLTHLVATGAVAVGDDLISSVAGGGVLSKVSRRFGEGVVNGALTARVGVAAIEVCRPLPFHASKRPSVTGLVQRALTGLFGR